MRPGGVSRRVTLFLVFIVANMAFVGYIVRRAINHNATGQPLHQTDAREAANRDRRESAQQVRAVEFERIAGALQTLEEAIVQLDLDNSEAVRITLLDAETSSSDPVPELSLNAVLSDRRVSRIYEFLKQLPPEVARKSCIEMFKNKLAGLMKMWHKLAPAIIKAQNPIVVPDLHRLHHSLAASVFLSVAFCEPADVINQCQEWNLSMRESMRVTGFDPSGYAAHHGVEFRDSLPSQLFVFNIYVFILQRHRQCGLEMLRSDDLVILPPISERCLMAWNWQPGNGKAEDKDVLICVPYCSGWRGIRPGDLRDQAVLHARQAVELCLQKRKSAAN